MELKRINDNNNICQGSRSQCCNIFCIVLINVLNNYNSINYVNTKRINKNKGIKPPEKKGRAENLKIYLAKQNNRKLLYICKLRNHGYKKRV